MTTYAVHRKLPGISMEDLSAAQGSAIEASKAASDGGRSIKYIRSNFFPLDSRCICVFEADNAEQVRELNEAAGLPFERIEEVLDLNP